MARPQAFGVLLGGYLAGIALGAAVARRALVRHADRDAACRALPWVLLVAAILAGLLVPVFARLVSASRHWELSIALAAVGSLGLGAIFPVLAHASVEPGTGAASSISWLYSFNLLGSVVGSVATGFVLMDHWGLATLSTTMTVAELTAAVWALTAVRHRFASARPVAAGLAMALGAALCFIVLQRTLFADLTERLFFRLEYSPARRFTRVVETRAGVIGVTREGAVYGSGVYDGMFNVQLRRAGENFIQRAYALAAFHPAPRDVMMIGLSSGSWAAVVANAPALAHLTIAEIDPGYLQLLPAHPPSNGLIDDPRVRIDIDDGRHWLVRHPDARFDAIVANTTYHWRANASSLLSVEFLQLVRRHLKPGGVFYYNVTSEPRAERTGAIVFPYAWRLYNMMVVSDAPITPDLRRMADQMSQGHVYEEPTFDPGSDADRRMLRTVVDDVEHDLESREHILARTAGLTLVTDDNMGTEWRLAPRYRF